MTMNIHRCTLAMAAATALAAPAIALAEPLWETTNDEPGSRIVVPRMGSGTMTAPMARVRADRPGAISPDRQYVFMGEEGGWQLRPMQFAIQGGRLVHVDDPEGHMSKVADRSPLTEAERATQQRLGGR
jgi:hypothetical protein